MPNSHQANSSPPQVQILDNVKQFATYGNSLNSVHAADCLQVMGHNVVGRLRAGGYRGQDENHLQAEYPGQDCPSVKDIHFPRILITIRAVFNRTRT